jgi:hypothetical protein
MNCPKCKARLPILVLRGHFTCPACKEQLSSNVGWFAFGIAVVVFLVGPFVVTWVCEGGYDDLLCWIPLEIVLAAAVGCLAYWSKLLRVKEDT